MTDHMRRDMPSREGGMRLGGTGHGDIESLVDVLACHRAAVAVG